MILLRRFLFVGFLAFSGVAAADAAGLQDQRSLDCRFDSGTVGPLGTPLGLAQINLDKGRAMVVTPTFSAPLLVVTTIKGLTFVERTEAGYVNLYSVFVGDPPWRAIISRHIPGPPASALQPAQFYGQCRPGR